MLVRVGVAGADSVPEGQRIAPAARATRALPGQRRPAWRLPPTASSEAAYASEEPSTRCDTRFDTRRAQQAIEAYRAAELVQPRSGLFLHVQA